MSKPAYDPTAQPYDEPFRHVESDLIECEVCQGEGRILRSNGGPDDIDCGICPECHGKREVEVECEPATIAWTTCIAPKSTTGSIRASRGPNPPRKEQKNDR